MYKQIMFAIAAAVLLTAFVTVASSVFNAHAQNATGGAMKNATGAAANATGAMKNATGAAAGAMKNATGK